MSLFPVWGVFETEIYCQKLKMAPNCSTKFFNNGTVKEFGTVPRGHKLPNVDIAGRGTIFAFLAPGAIVLAFHFLLILSLALDRGHVKKIVKHQLPRSRLPETIKDPSKNSQYLYNILESAIILISDTQLLLGLALAVSFLVIDRCEILQYHFAIGINLLLLACTGHLQALAIVRRRRSLWGRLATVLRVIAVGFLLYFIGWVLVTHNAQPYKGKHPFVPERVPPSDRKDSVIFLRAACFLDQDFQNSVFKKGNETIQLMMGQVGLEKNTGNSPEWVFWVMLVVATPMVCIVYLLGFCASRLWHESKLKMNSPPPANLSGGKWFDFVYWGLIWCLSFAVYINVCKTIFPLRDWAFKSGWLETNKLGGNAENDISGFGQSAALFSLATIVFAMLEQASEASEKNSKRAGGNEYIQMA